MTLGRLSWRALLYAHADDADGRIDPRGISKAAVGAIKRVSLVVRRSARRHPPQAHVGMTFRAMTEVNRGTRHGSFLWINPRHYDLTALITCSVLLTICPRLLHILAQKIEGDAAT
jgi:hypothetical protein